MIKKEEREKTEEMPNEKPIPAFYRDDYPYKAVGENIINLDNLDSTAVYEIRCKTCEMSVRSQGENIRSIYERMIKTGCISCGNQDLVLKQVDMNPNDN